MSPREVTFLSKVNGYAELKTKDKFEKVIHFVKTGNIPDGLTSRQQINYKKKYGPESGFEWSQEKLKYTPPENTEGINTAIEVVPPTDAARKAAIKSIYNDESLGLGVGLQQFYQQVSKHFVNIPKKLTDAFLQKQGDYTITRVPVNKTHLTINTQVPNQRWSVDLIDMTMYNQPGNKNMKYIFTCVDYFSGKVWARAIPNRENGTVETAADGNQKFKTKPTLSNSLKEIFQESNTIPNIIQVDNEFDKGAFKEVCKEKDIKLIAVLSHQSFTNGKVERMNRELRKKTKAGFVRHNNLLWVDHLQDYVDNINSQKNARTKRTPDEMWSEGYAFNDSMAERKANMTETQKQQNEFLKTQLDKSKERNERNVFKEGDWVRVKLLAYSKEMRQKKKNNIGWNQVAIHWSPDLYEIAKVIKRSATSTMPTEYYIRNKHSRAMVYKLNSYGETVGKRPRRLKGSDLILVPRGSKKVTIDPATYPNVLYFNRINRNK